MTRWFESGPKAATQNVRCGANRRYGQEVEGRKMNKVMGMREGCGRVAGPLVAGVRIVCNPASFLRGARKKKIKEARLFGTPAANCITCGFAESKMGGAFLFGID